MRQRPLPGGTTIRRPDARTHIFRVEGSIEVEHQILRDIIAPGSRVLDVGTGAVGRSALLCKSMGGWVTSIDINEAAVREFAGSGRSAGIELAVADLLQLPFADGSFDLVLVAFHGIDYLTDDEERHRAYAEMGRVLGASGHIVFNSWNRLATTISPRGLLSRPHVRLRLRHVVRGGFFRRTLIDLNGLRLRQSLPHTVIRDVRRYAGVDLAFVTNQHGSTKALSLLTPFSMAPYYVFRR